MNQVTQEGTHSSSTDCTMINNRSPSRGQTAEDESDGSDGPSSLMCKFTRCKRQGRLERADSISHSTYSTCSMYTHTHTDS